MVVTRGRGREEAAGKPLNARRATWWEERRQQETAERREQGMEGGKRRQQETAGRRERGMEGGEQAAGKPLEAVGTKGAQEQ